MDVAGAVMSSESAATSCAPPMLSAEFTETAAMPDRSKFAVFPGREAALLR